jgi:hypothetical protein
MNRMRLRRLPLVVLVAGLTLTVAGCTGGDTSGDAPPKPRPSPTASPTGPVELSMGESASVPLDPADKSSSQVDLAVTDVVQGDIRDLSEFELDRQTRRSTPYYADVEVTKGGTGDLTGRRVTLWGLDSTGTVRPPADVVGTFKECPPDPLPKGFTAGETAQTCLIYLLPEGTSLEAVQYRFQGGTAPYSWPVG